MSSSLNGQNNIQNLISFGYSYRNSIPKHTLMYLNEMLLDEINIRIVSTSLLLRATLHIFDRMLENVSFSERSMAATK